MFYPAVPAPHDQNFYDTLPLPHWPDPDTAAIAATLCCRLRAARHSAQVALCDTLARDITAIVVHARRLDAKRHAAPRNENL